MSEEATLDDIVEIDKSNFSEWSVRSLGELAEYQNGNAFSKSEWVDQGYPIIRIQNLTGAQDDFNYVDGDLEERYEVEAGDTLLSWSATIDVFQWTGSKAALNQHIFRVDASDEVNDTFYRFKLEHLLPRLVALSHGSTMQHVRKADLVNVDVNIPPLPEQRKIASVLYTFDRAIQKNEELKQKVQRIKKGLMQDLLSGKVRTTDNQTLKKLNVSEENALDDSVEIDKSESSEWRVRSLGELAEYQNGNAFSKSEWGDEGYPIIRIQNLTGEQDDFNYFDGDLEERYEVEAGDTLLSWSATIDVFQWTGSKAALNQHIFRVDASDEVNDTFYRFKLEHLLPRLVALSHGSTMQHVRKADLVNVDVNIPPLPEQRKIATALQTLDQVILKKHQRRDQLQRIKEGLMQELLSGKVRTTDIDIEVPDEVAQHG